MAVEQTGPIETHLEFLGYTADLGGGRPWSTARHDRRWNFFYQPNDDGVRFFSQLVVGRSVEERREERLEAVNWMIEASSVTRFTLAQDKDGDLLVRAKALFTGACARRPFGMSMDAWHADTALVNKFPEPFPIADLDEDGDARGVS